MVVLLGSWVIVVQELMVVFCRKYEENPSWVKIIAALEKMSETNLASQLRKKYQQQLQPNGEVATTRTSKDPTDQPAATESMLKVDRKDFARELLEVMITESVISETSLGRSRNPPQANDKSPPATARNSQAGAIHIDMNMHYLWKPSGASGGDRESAEGRQERPGC